MSEMYFTDSKAKAKIKDFLNSESSIINSKTEMLKAKDIVADFEGKYELSVDAIRVYTEISAESGSLIKNEMFFPLNWNGRFIAFGNGGIAGILPLNNSVRKLNSSFATATTDLGTSGGWFSGENNEAVQKDFGYRATHLMTELAKNLCKIIYGRLPDCSVFSGGSTGGAQALSEAQRYPDDYDGILCGAPANFRVDLHTYFIWICLKLKDEMRQPLFTENDAVLVHNAVLEFAVKNGYANSGDDFLSTLISEESEIKRCLEYVKDNTDITEKQFSSLCEIYCGPKNAQRKQIYAGVPLGSELKMFGLLDSSTCKSPAFSFPARWVLGKEADLFEFDFVNDYKKIYNSLSRYLDAKDGISEYLSKGKKMVVIVGGDDAVVPPQQTFNYFSDAVKICNSETVKNNLRYFLVPSFNHPEAALFQPCKIRGYDYYNLEDALFDWCESGKDIEKIEAEIKNSYEKARRKVILNPISLT